MTYDLRREPWIPWRRRIGALEWGPPATLVDGIGGDDPVVGLAAPRPDFDGALQEFLIGLLSAALHPDNDRAWATLRDDPPTTEALNDALERLPSAFDLEGDGPRFFQDLSTADFADTGIAAVEQLFIDTPGEQAKKLNKDLFVKRARVECLGRPAAAMALLTLQTYSPAGGQGHRTSLRGGGPLTTLVDPRVDSGGESLAHDQPLWQKLWANVETQEQLRDRSVSGASGPMEKAFPWLIATRTSEKGGGRETSPGSAHPLEAYFGLPRRIRLEFGEAGICGLTGEEDSRTVTGFRMRNYGTQYVGWQHPLTPHYRQKPTEPWLPRHGQTGGIGWSDWVGLTFLELVDGLRKPASVVPNFTSRARKSVVHLHVFGYDMDNMKARGWTDATMPVLAVADEARRKLLRDTASQLADATGMTSTALLGAVKTARFQNPKEASGDIGYLRTELWDATEDAFYRGVAELAAPGLTQDAAAERSDRLRASFASVLRDRALEVFDRWCPTPGLAPDVMRRRVAARYDLASTVNGYSKLGELIFTKLGVPLPGGGRTARTASTRARKEAAT